MYTSTPALQTNTRLCHISLSPLTQKQAFLTFPGILGHIHPKLNDVTGEHLTGRALLRPAAQTLAVDEGAIAAFGVLEIEL